MHLQTDPKTGILRYRRAFPAELRPYVSSDGRPLRELKVSLGARSLNSPEAKARHAAAARRYDVMVARARKLASGVYDRLDPPLVKYLAGNYLQRVLELDETARWRQPPPDIPFLTRRDYEADYEESRELLETYDAAGLVEYWGPWALEYAQAYGHTFDASTPAFADLCRALGEAACQLWLALDNRIEGIPVATPKPVAAPEPIEEDSLPPKATLGPSRSFDAIAQELLDNTRLASTFTPGVAEHVRTCLRYIRETLGTPAPEELTRAAISSLLDLMNQRPTKLLATERNLGLRELADLYADRPEVKRMSPRTQEVRMSSMSTLWKTAADNGAIPASLANPFVGRKYAKTSYRDKKERGFSADELRAYFGLPPFQLGERPVRGRGETIYWLPLLALYTGARPEEVAQLLVADVFPHDRDGRWVIRFTDEGIHPVKGPQSLKTAHNESGPRIFPVPQPLLDLGFVAYLMYLKDHGELALFPRLRRKGRRTGIYDSFGVWFPGYVYDHGVFERDTGRQPVRGFRHTWTTAARASGLYREAEEYIQGHQPPGGGSSNIAYGFRDVLGDQIHTLRIIDMHGEEVDVAALVKPWSPPADPK
jgi:integrase